MDARKALLFSALFVLVAQVYACPPGFDFIHGKCYYMGNSSTWDDANTECRNALIGDHLWIIDSGNEFDEVLIHFFGAGGNTSAPAPDSKQARADSFPELWTDGIFDTPDSMIWEDNGHPVSFDPIMGTRATCCEGSGCQSGFFDDGECVALGHATDGSQSGWGYMGCACSGTSTLISFICESADTAEYDCPDDGFFESGPCDELYYNCFGGVAKPEYCPPGLVFNEEQGYCDYPDNVEGCQATTLATTASP